MMEEVVAVQVTPRAGVFLSAERKVLRQSPEAVHVAR